MGDRRIKISGAMDVRGEWFTGDIDVNGVLIPENMSLGELAAKFENDAEILADFIINTIPGGTLDRFIVKLLKHKTESMLTIPYQRNR